MDPNFFRNQLPPNRPNPFASDRGLFALNNQQPTQAVAPAIDQNWASDPNQIYQHLGDQGYQVGYNSNDVGSYERNYNSMLQNLTPDLLLKRYQLNNASLYGTDADRAGYRAYSAFKSIMGRDPNGSEFSQILPSFQGPNGAINGNAYLANLQQLYKSNPSLDPLSAQNNQKPEDLTASVNQQFQSILGRAPTSDELQHFSEALRTNQTDAYGLASFLKQQPEYTNAQDKQFRSSLNDELTNYDTQAFNRQKGDVISAYAQNGFAPGFDENGKSLSPSLDYALTDLMGKIAQNRGSFLTQLSASQYGGNKDLAVGNYKNTLNQMYDNNQQQRQQQQGYGQQLLDRGFQGADYTTQRNDMMNYMNSIPQKKPNFFDYLNTGANVVNAGANLYRAGK